MARKWTKLEEQKYRKELHSLYEKSNLSIGQISKCLGICEQSVFKRIKRLGLTPHPSRKSKYRNKRTDIQIPEVLSDPLAEFFGIMLGDGHVSHFQTVVTLGTKEASYALHVQKLITSLFVGQAKISVRASGYRDVYLGSTEVTSWLKKSGLVSHKVQSQVGVPEWIFSKKSYMNAFVRGFFDTDGSVYRLKFGIQISFTNRSFPLLKSLQFALRQLQYTPSAISGYQVYLTRKIDIERFLKEVKPKNPKHVHRMEQFLKERK